MESEYLLDTDFQSNLACGEKLEECLAQLLEGHGGKEAKEAILDAIAAKHSGSDETQEDWDSYLDKVRAAYTADVLPLEQAETAIEPDSLLIVEEDDKVNLQ